MEIYLLHHVQDPINFFVTFLMHLFTPLERWAETKSYRSSLTEAPAPYIVVACCNIFVNTYLYISITKNKHESKKKTLRLKQLEQELEQQKAWLHI